jgi:AraC-like DNA-binding protein
LVVAGSGHRGKLNNWWNFNKLADSRGRFGLVILLKDAAGFFGDSSGFECSLQYGDFFLDFPESRIRYAPGRDEVWSELCIGFEGPVFNLLLEHEVLSPTRSVWSLAEPAKWIKTLSLLVEQPRPKSPLGAAHETAAFLEILLAMLESATPKQPGPATSDWFYQACVLLTSDLSRPLDLKTIASELGMNYETFRLQFRRRSGLAPGQYFDAMRCEEARRMLTTSSTCWEIALYLGFCNEQYFSRRFKSWTGLTPRQYRNAHSPHVKTTNEIRRPGE